MFRIPPPPPIGLSIEGRLSNIFTFTGGVCSKEAFKGRGRLFDESCRVVAYCRVLAISTRNCSIPS